LGKEFDEKLRSEPNSRGCELRVLGEVRYDRKKQAIECFDVAGIGRAWGNKMNYVHREVRLDQYPWMYGIAWELVTGVTPQDRIPPYNLLHYNSTGPYFESRKRTMLRQTGTSEATQSVPAPAGDHRRGIAGGPRGR